MPYIVEKVSHLARGLRLPSHMAVTAENRVFVSEFGGGTIHEVTNMTGESVSSKTLVFDNLKNPSGLFPNSRGNLLVADSGNSQILELNPDKPLISDVTTLSEGTPNPYGVFENKGEIFTTFSNNSMSGIYKVRTGKAFQQEDAFLTNFPVVVMSEPYPEMQGCGGSWIGIITQSQKIFFSHYALGAIYNVTAGGDFEDYRDNRFAWGLTGPLGMIEDPLDGDLYVVEKGAGVVKRIQESGGYSRFAQPLISGFQEPSCIRFLQDGSAAFICDRAWGTVFKLNLRYIEEDNKTS